MSANDSPTVQAARASLPCTAFKVRSLSRRITQLYDDTIAPSGLRSTQFSLLAHARRPHGGTAPRVGELADALRMDRTTLTRNLRPLLAAGLIVLDHGPDARSKAIRVTEAGEQAFRTARERWRIAQQRIRMIGGLAEVQHLEGLIDTMLARLDAHETQPDRGSRP
jgi:DNA-binding MarR family transcriptional regulator